MSAPPRAPRWPEAVEGVATPAAGRTTVTRLVGVRAAAAAVRPEPARVSSTVAVTIGLGLGIVLGILVLAVRASRLAVSAQGRSLVTARPQFVGLALAMVASVAIGLAVAFYGT